MKKYNLILAAFCVMWSVSTNASAGDSSGLITLMQVYPPGDIAIVAAGVHNNKPACSVVGDQWVFPLTSTGKALFALLLDADARGKSVAIAGSGNCTVWADRETAVNVWVNY